MKPETLERINIRLYDKMQCEWIPEKIQTALVYGVAYPFLYTCYAIAWLRMNQEGLSKLVCSILRIPCYWIAKITIESLTGAIILSKWIGNKLFGKRG